MMRKSWMTVFAFPGLLLATTGLILAQSGSRSGGSRPQSGSGTVPAQRSLQTPRTSPRELSTEAKLWDWLQKVQYKNWSPLPGVPAAAYAGAEPHGATVRLYANRTAAGNPEELPHGSILVKENYGSDPDAVEAITVMYRVKGYDTRNGDWFWARYDSDGRVSVMNGMPVAGRVDMCIKCHSSAAGGDFSFANDPR